MFKPSARVGLAAAVCFGANGENPVRIVRHGKMMAADVEADGTISNFDGVHHSLLQGTSVSLAADISTKTYRGQSANLVGELEQLAAGAKELPAEIKTFIDLIKTQAAEIKTKLTDEHALQAEELDQKFNAFQTCDDVLTAAQASNSFLSSRTTNLCTCLEDQAKAKLNSQGCQDELTCWDDRVVQTDAAQNDFLLIGNTPKDQYTDDTGTSMCADPDAWKREAGATDVAKALEWISWQTGASTAHWTQKKDDLTNLIAAYDTAIGERDALRHGTAPYDGRGCDALSTLLSEKESECTSMTSSLKLSYCNYYSAARNACDEYHASRATASADWEAAKTREEKNSEDRKSGWEAASKVECLAGTFTDNDAGNVEIDAAASAACSALTCDAECMGALDLSAKLARSPADPMTCTTPTPTPPCTCASPSAMHTPSYFVGARTGAQCTVAAVAVDLEDAQVTAACQECL